LPRATAENSLPRTQRVLAYAKDRHSAAYWQRRVGDMDYDIEDKLDTERFNRELWKGMMGNKPYPQARSGKNLRENRDVLLTSEQHKKPILPVCCAVSTQPIAPLQVRQPPKGNSPISHIAITNL
jgi:hypothetical protein